MIKNYLLTALRFLKRNKLFAGINILGLSLALAVSFIILLFVINELSYNSGFRNRKQIYRVLNYYQNLNITDDETSYMLSKSIKEEFPQVKYVAPISKLRNFNLKLKEEFIPVNNAVGTDSEIFQIFDILVVGQTNKILNEPNSIVLSRELAQKFFAGEDPIGKDLTAFSFKAGISFWFFVIPFAVTIMVVGATVFFHSYRATCTNPVEALRYE